MSERTDLISVIIPVYNVESYLRRCLESVAGNTYRNLQIICIDDGSTDQSGAILDEYADKDPRFTIVHQANGGVSSARNAGLSLARGDYISFVDSDDWIHPQFFEILISFAEKTESKLAVSDFVRANKCAPMQTIDAEQVKTFSFGVEKLFAMGSIKRCVWGKLYRAELLRGLTYDEQVSFGEDTLFNIDIICRLTDFPVCYIKWPLYYYYDRPISLAHSASSGNIISLGIKMLDYSNHRSVAPAVKSLLLKQAIKDFLSARYEACVTSEPKEKIKMCNKLLRDSCREMLQNKCFSFSETARYLVLCGCPQVYRLWRIRDDSTLLDWERNHKQRRKNRS